MPGIPLFSRHRRRVSVLSLMLSAGLLTGCGSMFGSDPEPSDHQPTVASQRSTSERPAAPTASGRAIQADVLIVDDTPITMEEVLYLIRRPVALAKREGAGDELRDQVTRWVLEITQQALGTVLLDKEARRKLTDAQIKQVEQYAAKEIDSQVARGFGGSRTRFADHLGRFGLSLEQYEKIVTRTTLAQQYTRDRFLPMIHIRRAELLDYYEKNVDRYTEPQLRELFMIAIPYESQLPPRKTWIRSTASEREAAQQRARERILAAQQALRSGRSFEDVAKEFGEDAMAPLGGAWGPIGEPLRQPYEEPSRRLFGLPPQGISEPIQNEHGWYIVKCGQVQGGERPRFDAIQARMRSELADERLVELTNKYMGELAQKASLSPVEPFVRSATERALQPGWPPLAEEPQLSAAP